MRDTVGPFTLGENNRRAVSDLSTVLNRSRVDYLVRGTNTDLLEDGKVARRAGVTKVLDGQMKWLWGDGGPTGYGVYGTDLVAIRKDGSASVILPGMNPALPVAYARRDQLVFMTDGLRVRALQASQVLTPPATPYEPVAAADVGGGLDAGMYQLAFTSSNALGESPSTEPQAVQVEAGGAIKITGLSAPPGTTLHTYITGPNGSVFNEVDLVVDSGVAVVVGHMDAGRKLETMGLQPLPPGSALAVYDSRLLVAAGSLLFYSNPFAPLLCDPASSYIPFEHPITMVRACGGGVYVGTSEKTYRFSGDLAQADRTEVLPYGALPGSDSADPNEPTTVFWMSPRGLIRGDGAGEVTNLQSDNLQMNGGVRGATYLREREGQSLVIASTQGAGARGAVYASMDAEIVKGVSP